MASIASYLAVCNAGPLLWAGDAKKTVHELPVSGALDILAEGHSTAPDRGVNRGRLLRAEASRERLTFRDKLTCRQPLSSVTALQHRQEPRDMRLALRHRLPCLMNSQRRCTSSTRRCSDGRPTFCYNLIDEICGVPKDI
jgi:hypothetical protein